MDGGQNWIRCNFNIDGRPYALAVDPSNSDIVYVGGSPGLYRTDDGGENWYYSSSGINDTIYTIAIDTDSPTTLYVGAPAGIFKSINGAVTWIYQGLQGGQAVLIQPGSSNTIYAGTRNGMYISTQGGDNWMSMNEGLVDSNVTSLGVYSDHYLYAGTNLAGMYRFDLSTGIEEIHENAQVSNLSVWPNPFRERLNVAYCVERKAYSATIYIYDAIGQLVKSFRLTPDVSHATYLSWDGIDEYGRKLPCGVYFIKLVHDGHSEVRSVLHIR